MDSNHQHVPCNGKNDCCRSHRHDLHSFTALPIELPRHITAYYGQALKQSVWVEFHTTERKLRTCFLNWKPVNRKSNNLLLEEYLPELPTCGIEPPVQVIRTGTPCFSWQIAGGGIEPPFRAKEARELPILHPASTRGVRVSNDFFVLCVPLGNFS